MEQDTLSKIEATHMAVYFIQGAIREALRHFENMEQGTKAEKYEKYSRPVCIKLINVCSELLNELDEKDRFFPNLIKTEQDLRNFIGLD